MAGRKGKERIFTTAERTQIIERILGGESLSIIGADYGVSKATLSRKFSDAINSIGTTALQVLKADEMLERLKRSDRIVATSLAERLRAISQAAAESANSGMQVSTKLMELAAQKAEALPEEFDLEDVRPIAALVETANKGAEQAYRMLAANKDRVQEDEEEER